MVSGQPVVAGGNSPEVLQPIERAFDAPAQLVEALAEAERLLPVAAVRNDPAWFRAHPVPRATRRCLKPCRRAGVPAALLCE
jgi:hypothetical protein